MKYIILHPTNQAGLTQILFAVAPTTHAELAAKYAETHKPTSAGFCDFRDGPVPARPSVRVFGRSTSLNLGPAEGDARLIAQMVTTTLSMAPAA